MQNEMSEASQKLYDATKPYFSGFRERKQTFMLKDAAEREVPFFAGLLLMYGASNTGKSTTGLGLVVEAAIQGVKASHLVFDEVGTQLSTELTPVDKVTKAHLVSIFTPPAAGFNNTISAAAILNDYFGIITNELTARTPKLVVIDSIGPVLAASSGLIDQPAGKGAMVEGYGMFLRTLNQIALVHGCTIIGLVNSSLFTVDSLEGAVDGVLQMTTKGSFLKRDRTNRNLNFPFMLSHDAVLKALSLQGSQSVQSAATRVF